MSLYLQYMLGWVPTTSEPLFCGATLELSDQEGICPLIGRSLPRFSQLILEPIMSHGVRLATKHLAVDRCSWQQLGSEGDPLSGVQTH